MSDKQSQISLAKRRGPKPHRSGRCHRVCQFGVAPAPWRSLRAKARGPSWSRTLPACLRMAHDTDGGEVMQRERKVEVLNGAVSAEEYVWMQALYIWPNIFQIDSIFSRWKLIRPPAFGLGGRPGTAAHCKRWRHPPHQRRRTNSQHPSGMRWQGQGPATRARLIIFHVMAAPPLFRPSRRLWRSLRQPDLAPPLALPVSGCLRGRHQQREPWVQPLVGLARCQDQILESRERR